MKYFKIITIVLFSLFFLNMANAQVTKTLKGLDVSGMIPLHFHGKTYPVIQIKSDAFKTGIQEFTFDTGGGMPGVWIAYEALSDSYKNKIKSKINNPNTQIRNFKGKKAIKADPINLQLDRKNSGLAAFNLSNFDCYVFKPGQINLQSENDRKIGMIVGAFPSMGTLTYKLAEKYAVNGNKGFGVYANTPSGNINDNWNDLKIYLQIGPLSGMNNLREIKWAKKNGGVFKPGVIPGFKLRLTSKTGAVYTSKELITTLDTGHDFLSTRLDGDPQNSADFSSYFQDSRWHTASKSKWMKEGLRVEILFTDKNNEENSYAFPSNDAKGFQTLMRGTYVPNAIIISKYDNNLMPLPYKTSNGVSIKDQPQNRMFLGNNVHFYCPLLYWDISGERFGLGFHKPEVKRNTLNAGESLLSNEKLYSSNGAYYLLMQDDGNLCIYKTEGNRFVWCSMAHGFKNGKLIMQADGNLCVYDASNTFKWGSYQVKKYSLASGSKTVLTNDGKLNILDSSDKVIWVNQ